MVANGNAEIVSQLCDCSPGALVESRHPFDDQNADAQLRIHRQDNDPGRFEGRYEGRCAWVFPHSLIEDRGGGQSEKAGE